MARRKHPPRWSDRLIDYHYEIFIKVTRLNFFSELSGVFAVVTQHVEGPNQRKWIHFSPHTLHRSNSAQHYAASQREEKPVDGGRLQLHCLGF